MLAATMATTALAAPSVVARSPIDTSILKQSTAPVELVVDIFTKIEASVSVEVDVIVAVIGPVGSDQTKQLSIVSEVVADLDVIIADVKVAIGGVLAIVLPTVLDIVADVVELVGVLLAIVLSLVDELIVTLVTIIDSLLGPIKALVITELTAVIALVGPLIEPVLKFVLAIAADVPDVSSNVTHIVTIVNGVVSGLGLPILTL